MKNNIVSIDSELPEQAWSENTPTVANNKSVIFVASNPDKVFMKEGNRWNKGIEFRL